MSAFGSFLSLVFQRILYVRIWRNRLSVLDVSSGATFDDEPWAAIAENPKRIVNVGRSAKNSAGVVVNPFAHPRTLISDFTVAEKVLQHAIRSLNGHWWQPPPTIIMHPLEMLEGGLTQIESRALRELALGAGARTVYLRLGRELTRDEIRAGFKHSNITLEPPR